MGKRTNPPGLRSDYSQVFSNELAAPSYLHSYNSKSQAELLAAFGHILAKAKLEVYWISAVYRGFFWQIHVFNVKSGGPLCSAFTRRSLQKHFWGRLCIRHHSISDWLRVYRRRKRSLRTSLGRIKRHRANRFFFRTAAFLQLSISAMSPELLTKVVCMLFKKHNKRHWLVFRFLKVTLNYYYRRYKAFIGLRLQIAGKINGRRRKKRRTISFGPMPLQGISNDVGYSYRVVVTKFGAFGTKLWLLRHHSENNERHNFQ